MYYILDRIDSINKVIYMQSVDNLVNDDVINDYYRILQYANENNYTIEYIYDKDNFSKILNIKSYRSSIW